jgi:hypothetical protein
MKTFDIRDDLPDFHKYVQARVKQQLKVSPKTLPVRRIDFGFSLGQANWVALVFDTRKDAAPDGEWSSWIDDILLERPKWPALNSIPDKFFMIGLDGKKRDVMKDKDPDRLMHAIIGDALKHTLIMARDEAVFKPLLKAPKCELGVEHLDGYYGWPEYKDRGKENLVS